MPSTEVKPHVVIVGGGFAGLETARWLRRADVRVTLVDRQNYHLFQPLLYQVATGGLSPANIASPLRYLLRRQKNCEVLLAEVVGFDLEGRRLLLADGALAYDYLVVAAGATHSYFGNDQWSEHAPGLKSIADAIEIRRKVFLAFEEAERTADPAARRALMTLVVVGGGPTGVELAGALSEIARHTLRHDFRRIDPSEAQIVIVEAGAELLGHYPKDLCDYTLEKVRSMGADVRLESRVTEVAEDHVLVQSGESEERLDTRTVLWAAGVAANSLGKEIADACGVETDRAGRVPVTPGLTVGERADLFVIGDLALCKDEQGKPLPGLAPVAMQQGKFVAESIAARREGKGASAAFRYVDRGSMATIGRAAAVAQIGERRYRGFFAWLLWLGIHLFQIVLFQNRLLVFTQWSWNYLTYNRSARIITGREEPAVVRSVRSGD